MHRMDGLDAVSLQHPTFPHGERSTSVISRRKIHQEVEAAISPLEF